VQYASQVGLINDEQVSDLAIGPTPANLVSWLGY